MITPGILLLSQNIEPLYLETSLRDKQFALHLNNGRSDCVHEHRGFYTNNLRTGFRRLRSE